MQSEIVVAVQELLDARTLVGREVVENDVNAAQTTIGATRSSFMSGIKLVDARVCRGPLTSDGTRRTRMS